MSDFSLEPTGVTPPPPLSERTSVWRAATIALAVLCLGLGFWLFRATDGFGSSDEGSPEAMVSMACSIVADIDPGLGSGSPGPDGDAMHDLDRVGAAIALARLAAAEDPDLGELHEVSNMELLAGGDLRVVIEDSQAYCADR